jgi:hypothetical protein
MKTCKRCQINKEVNCFSKDKNSKDGLETYCKECRKEIKSNWYLNNKEEEIKKVVNYKKTNLDAISKTQIKEELLAIDIKCLFKPIKKEIRE